MTNQPTERLRSGRLPGRRGSGDGRRASFGLLVLALLTAVAPSWAAEVVEVRVGRHPDFTRVVFELDRTAGYRIERSDPSAKESELIVSLEAGSIPRRIQSTKSFIEQVVVEPSGTRSVARIRLARSGLRLKEMILASPPRIVLDVIAEPGTPTTTAQSSTPASTTKIAAAPPKPAPAATPAPKPTAVVANAAPTPKATPTPAVTPSPSEPAPSAAATPAPKTRVLASTEDPDAKTPSPAPAADALAANTAEAAGSDAPPSEWNDGGAADPNAAALAEGTGADPSAAAEPANDAAGTGSPKARPMMVQSTDAEEEGGGLLTWSLAGVGLLVAAFGGLVVARRRRAAAELEDEDDEEAADAADEEDEETEEGEEEEEEESPRSVSSNPFAELTGGSASLASGMTRSGASTARPTEKSADKPEKKPSESLLFDDAEEKTMEGMEVISRSQVNESLGGAMPMMGAGSDELTQMFREMQRRVAALEGRIDELVDARDRLERQVAAQTEELRVQRAAIARTQRAVRNLARPEEGNDDEPTEPALRDPN